MHQILWTIYCCNHYSTLDSLVKVIKDKVSTNGALVLSSQCVSVVFVQYLGQVASIYMLTLFWSHYYPTISTNRYGASRGDHGPPSGKAGPLSGNFLSSSGSLNVYDNLCTVILITVSRHHAMCDVALRMGKFFNKNPKFSNFPSYKSKLFKFSAIKIQILNFLQQKP